MPEPLEKRELKSMQFLYEYRVDANDVYIYFYCVRNKNNNNNGS